MKSRHLLGQSLEAAVDRAVLWTMSYLERERPCFVVTHEATGKFFQCAGGRVPGGLSVVRLEIPWTRHNGNGAVDLQELCTFFHIVSYYGDFGVCASLSYEHEGVSIQGVQFRDLAQIGRFGVKICRELFRLGDTAELEVDEFFQTEDELCDPKAVAVLGMLGGGDA